MDFFVDD